MIAKKYALIINVVKISSLQTSLQRTQLRAAFQRSYCLQPSLQFPIVLQTVCKKNKPDYQAFYKNPVCSPVCRNPNLNQA